MLDEAQIYGHQLVISWLPHGKAFLVHDRPYLASHILPHYFKSKFTSFRQALRHHGFAQMGGSGWDAGAYYHRLFVRDDPSLCQGLTQQQMKEGMPQWVPANEEPNFYISCADYEMAVSAMVALQSTVDANTPVVREELTGMGETELAANQEAHHHHRKPDIATPMSPFMKSIASTKPVSGNELEKVSDDAKSRHSEV